jgi:hypothetical protein
VNRAILQEKGDIFAEEFDEHNDCRKLPGSPFRLFCMTIWEHLTAWPSNKRGDS